MMINPFRATYKHIIGKKKDKIYVIILEDYDRVGKKFCVANLKL